MIKNSEEAKNAISDEFGLYKFGIIAKQMDQIKIWTKLLDRIEELSAESFTLGQKSTKRSGKPDTDLDRALTKFYADLKSNEVQIPKNRGGGVILKVPGTFKELHEKIFELLDNLYPHLRYLPDPEALLNEMKETMVHKSLHGTVNAAIKVAYRYAESALQAVFNMDDEEYEKLQTNIQELINPLVDVKDASGQPSNLSGPHTDDAWKQRSKYMICGSCMNYQAKGFDTFGRAIGACKDNSPTIKGYPRVFFDEKGCGAHKLAVIDKPK